MYRMPPAGRKAGPQVDGFDLALEGGRGREGQGVRQPVVGQTADAQRIISKKRLAFSCVPRHNPVMLEAEVSGR
jgi:hypothetical protein